MSILAATYGPFIILLLGVLTVVVMIARLKIHPFFALIVSAILIGILTLNLPFSPDSSRLLQAIELPMIEFGKMAGKISWVIAIAALIGYALLESGGAQKIVAVLLKVFGEKRASLALLISGLILSIPVFFDTVFFLLIPLAIALAQKTKKNYVLYVVAISGGAIITHGLVPPTPGPLIVADTLDLELGMVIIMGLLFSIIPAIAVLLVGKYADNKIQLLPGSNIDNNHYDKLPSLGLSLAPIALPIILIALVSICNVTLGSTPSFIEFLGNKNIAMAIGGICAIYLWMRSKSLSNEDMWKQALKPLEIAGVIILITSAGGAFGAMIKHTGIGDSIAHYTSGMNISFIILAWIISALMKTAQGSSTVAMITSASIISGILAGAPDLDYHPVYILLSIGFGAGFISWMNDSAFWVISRMAGFSEKQTIQTWTLAYATISVVGLIQILIFSTLIPLI